MNSDLDNFMIKIKKKEIINQNLQKTSYKINKKKLAEFSLLEIDYD
jgi:hypothetical protein